LPEIGALQKRVQRFSGCNQRVCSIVYHASDLNG